MIRRLLIALLAVIAVLLSLVFDEPSSAGSMATGPAHHSTVGPHAPPELDRLDMLVQEKTD